MLESIQEKDENNNQNNQQIISENKQILNQKESPQIIIILNNLQNSKSSENQKTQQTHLNYSYKIKNLQQQNELQFIKESIFQQPSTNQKCNTIKYDSLTQIDQKNESICQQDRQTFISSFSENITFLVSKFFENQTDTEKQFQNQDQTHTFLFFGPEKSHKQKILIGHNQIIQSENELTEDSENNKNQQQLEQKKKITHKGIIQQLTKDLKNLKNLKKNSLENLEIELQIYSYYNQKFHDMLNNNQILIPQKKPKTNTNTNAFYFENPPLQISLFLDNLNNSLELSTENFQNLLSKYNLIQNQNLNLQQQDLVQTFYEINIKQQKKKITLNFINFSYIDTSVKSTAETREAILEIKSAQTEIFEIFKKIYQEQPRKQSIQSNLNKFPLKHFLQQLYQQQLYFLINITDESSNQNQNFTQINHEIFMKIEQITKIEKKPKTQTINQNQTTLSKQKTINHLDKKKSISTPNLLKKQVQNSNSNLSQEKNKKNTIFNTNNQNSNKKAANQSQTPQNSSNKISQKQNTNNYQMTLQKNRLQQQQNKSKDRIGTLQQQKLNQSLLIQNKQRPQTASLNVNNDFKNQLDQLQNELKTYKDQNKKLQISNQELKNQIENQTKQLKHQEQNNKNYNQSQNLNKNSNSVTENKDQNVQQKTQQQNEDRIQKLTEEIKQLKSSLQKEQLINAKFQIENSKNQKKITEYEEKSKRNSLVQQNPEEFQNQLANQLKNKMEMLQQKIDAQQSEIQIYKDQLNTKTSQLDNVTKTFNQMEKTIRDNENLIENYQIQINQLKQQANLKETPKENKTQQGATSDVSKNFSIECENLKKQIQIQDKQINEKNQQLEILQNIAQDLQKKLKQEQDLGEASMLQLRQSIAMNSQIRIKQQNQNNNSHTNNSPQKQQTDLALKQKLIQKDQLIKDLQEELEEIKKEHLEQEIEIKELSEQNEKLQQELKISKNNQKTNNQEKQNNEKQDNEKQDNEKQEKQEKSEKQEENKKVPGYLQTTASSNKHSKKPQKNYQKGKVVKKARSNNKIDKKELKTDHTKGMDPKLIEQISNQMLQKTSNIDFNDIAGLTEIKQILTEAILWPVSVPHLFKAKNIKLPKGLLMYGPPGNGKSFLAKAISNLANITFFDIPISSLTSKNFGDSEKLITALFALAKNHAPSIIFIDEIDAIAGKRGKSNEQEVTLRMKNELLKAITDCETSNIDEYVMVLGATNRPWEIDDALLRRLEKRILIDNPDHETRVALLKLKLDGQYDKDMDFDLLSQKMIGYSGDDISQICTKASLLTLKEKLLQQNDITKFGALTLDDIRPTNQNDLLEAQKTFNKAVSEETLQLFQEWKQQFGSM
ncbi:P-loop containing nucleoside triphosphate hydrolase [Pseudocohnilembus persalinus]|uniref:p-loop containing nucleoside triphosphate hydrolase n=1 Tax=Pseudocohnilembus persalinus TaxID=266149 RepID=A0A0V0QYK6_PSEPJ|nr:P-loop containing nucleoside triphosphate hydrolase [Pseudocohnilembus persalinus]|eukprot:KRX07104.1 P-loop containing nucleoside triphosphate hydrolase [Pseudocohnilembus persalinus]